MPQFVVTSPQGKKFRVTAPEGASQQQVMDYVKSQMGGGPGPSPTELEPIGPLPAAGKGVAMGLTDLAGLPGDLANMVIGKAGTDINRLSTMIRDPKKVMEAIKNPEKAQKLLAETESKARLPLGISDIRKGVESLSQAAGMDRHAVVYDDPSQANKYDRPFVVGGEAFASAFGGGRLFRLLEGAEKANAATQTARLGARGRALMESTGATGAALGGGAAATVTDDPKKIAGAEVIGSLISPTALAVRGASMAGKDVSGGLKSLFSGANEFKAAKYLQTTLREQGEDPNKLAAIIRDTQAKGLKLTGGQATQSPVLLELERGFAKRNARFGKFAAQNAKNSMETLRTSADALQATGNPEAIRAAAKLRQAYFDKLLGGKVDQAKVDLLRATAKLSPESKAAAGDVSAQAYDVLDSALKDARKTEKAMWGNIPKDVSAPMTGTMAAAQGAKTTYLPEMAEVPPGLTPFFKAVKGNDGSVSWVSKVANPTTGELMKLRSEALDLSRKAQAAGDWRAAGVYSTIAGKPSTATEAATGVMADLEAVPGISKPLTNARDYSRALHDTFTRTFAGDALAKDATGAAAIEPETLLRRTLGGGAEGANLRFDQLLSAAKFGNERLSQAMQGIQERYLRQSARRLVDPATGKVSEAGLANFQRDNEALLEQFPNLRADFKSVTSAQKALDDAVALRDKATKAMKQRALFGQLIENEDPAYAVGQMLKGNPIANYAQISRFAKAEGPEAMAGLRTSTLEHAFNQAFDNSGELSWTRFKQNLTAPIGRGRVSMMDLMKRNGVISPKDEERLMEIVNRGEEIESAARAGNLDIAPPQEDMLQDLIIATGASKLGKVLSKPMGGTTLVAQSAFTKAGRKLFEKLPNARIMDFIMNATENPDTMAALLEKPVSAQGAKSAMDRLQEALERGGYIPRGPLVSAGIEMTKEQPQGQQ